MKLEYRIKSLDKRLSSDFLGGKFQAILPVFSSHCSESHWKTAPRAFCMRVPEILAFLFCKSIYDRNYIYISPNINFVDLLA